MGGIRDVVKGEGGVTGFYCLSLTQETFRFTVPPAVALMYYMRSGFFSKLEFSWGFFYSSIFAGRMSEAAMGGAG